MLVWAGIHTSDPQSRQSWGQWRAPGRWPAPADRSRRSGAHWSSPPALPSACPQPEETLTTTGNNKEISFFGLAATLN